jgi:hypothetical protein
VGEKNMASSSGWAMRRMMRALRRVPGAGKDDALRTAVATQKARKKRGARPAYRRVEVDMMRAGRGPR